jgi:hypothetical protein
MCLRGNVSPEERIRHVSSNPIRALYVQDTIGISQSQYDVNTDALTCPKLRAVASFTPLRAIRRGGLRAVICNTH